MKQRHRRSGWTWQHHRQRRDNQLVLRAKGAARWKIVRWKQFGASSELPLSRLHLQLHQPLAHCASHGSSHACLEPLPRLGLRRELRSAQRRCRWRRVPLRREHLPLPQTLKSTDALRNNPFDGNDYCPKIPRAQPMASPGPVSPHSCSQSLRTAPCRRRASSAALCPACKRFLELPLSPSPPSRRFRQPHPRSHEPLALAYRETLLLPRSCQHLISPMREKHSALAFSGRRGACDTLLRSIHIYSNHSRFAVWSPVLEGGVQRVEKECMVRTS